MYNLLVYYPISNHFIYRLVNNIHIFIKLSILFSFLQLVLFFVQYVNLLLIFLDTIFYYYIIYDILCTLILLVLSIFSAFLMEKLQ